MIREGKYSNWEEVTPIVNKQLFSDEVDYKGESAFRKEVKYARNFFEAGVFNTYNDDAYLKELEIQKRELQREKIKFRDERNAWQKQNYIDARIESNFDMLDRKLSDIGRNKFEKHEIVNINSDNDLICCLSDLHIGETFDSQFGRYNTDIAKERLNKYLNEVIKIGKRHNSENIYVSLLGDMISGNIHLSIQVSNRENLIEQVEIASELISNFCYELSKEFKHVYITTVDGNHSRLVAKKDLDIKDERLDSLISWIVEKTTSHIDNITVLHENFDSSISSMVVRGKKYIGVHGDNDYMNSNSIGKLVMMLGMFPYAILGGHRHSPAYQEFNGIKYVQSGTIAGSGDDYTLTKRLQGNPNQTVMVCTDKGIECIYNVDL